jgi:hypothetical protein
VFMTSGTYPWSFVTQIFHIAQPSHGSDRYGMSVYPHDSNHINLSSVDKFSKLVYNLFIILKYFALQLSNGYPLDLQSHRVSPKLYFIL